MNPSPGYGLVEIVDGIIRAVGCPTPSQAALLDRLRQMSERLRDGSFRLAVLGQFKRGKSSLLNAILGYPLLSTGLLPLTAVPTFLAKAPIPTLSLRYSTGDLEQRAVPTMEQMAAAIAAATTEEQNPRNLKGLERVEVGIPSTPWLDDLILIDTPGIGSTHAHNTDIAHAVLPECDAALFVLSVDPPITEVEVEYLTSVCRTVSRIIVVLNKVDIVDAAGEQKLIVFLSSVIARQNAPQIDPRIISVSAKSALAAIQAGDRIALDASGLPALERYVRSALIEKKRDHLATSVANKTAGILNILEADAALAARALTVPLAELDANIGIFERAAGEFVRERDDLQDLLSGEWRRTLARLDSLCRTAERRARSQLDKVVTEVNRFARSDTDRIAIDSVMTTVFDKEFEAIGGAVDQELAAAVAAHQGRYRNLVARVRESAASLMDVPMSPAAVNDDWFQISREPYWVGQAPVENLSSITADWLSRLLPLELQRRRRLRQLRRAIDNAVTRNIADLHWTMRQNVDDSFRRLLASSSEAVDTSIASTREVLATAQEARRSTDSSLQFKMERASATIERLASLRPELEQRRKSLRL